MIRYIQAMTLDALTAPPSKGPSKGLGVTHATLIFNRRAGGSERASPDHLVEALHRIGYRPVYRATDDEADLAAALRDARGTVFVAGGDGTVRAAALHLAGRPGLRLGILPLGTANNIGRSLGVGGGALDVIAAYAGARAVPLDLGRVTAPWGTDLFLEACGCGVFADVLAEYGPEEGKSPLRAAGALTAAVREFTPQPLALTLDGERQPEGRFALLEVMNTPATGPRLRLGTGADPSDGRLNVVRVDAAKRDGVLAYLAALARDTFAELPSVQNDLVRVIEVPYRGQPFHVDGEVRPARPGETGTVRVEVWAGALSVLIPGSQEE